MVKIIGRDGKERAQGDTSSWSNSSSSRTVSLKEASSGHAAKTTASRNTKGEIVGDSQGSRYTRQQEAQQLKKSTPSPSRPSPLAPRPSASASPSISPLSSYPGLAATAAASRPSSPQTPSSPPSRYSSPSILGKSKTPHENPNPQTFDHAVGARLPTLGGIEDHRKNTMSKLISPEFSANYERKLQTAKEEHPTFAFASSTAVGGYKEFKEKPVTTGLKTAGWVALDLVGGPLIAGAGKVLGKSKTVLKIGETAAKIPGGKKTLQHSDKILVAGLAAPYAYGAHQEINAPLMDNSGVLRDPTASEKGERTGHLFAGDLLPMFGGFAAGSALKARNPLTKTVTEKQTERQFNVLEGVERTEIEALEGPRVYTKIKTRTAPESTLNPADIRSADPLLSSKTREFDIKYKRTVSKTDYLRNTQVRAAEGEGRLTLTRPEALKAEQKTLSGDILPHMDRGKWTAEFKGLPEGTGKSFKKDLKKEWTIEQFGGKETPDYVFATQVRHTRARPLQETTKLPEKPSAFPKDAEKYFDVPGPFKKPDLYSFESTEAGHSKIFHRSRNLLPGEKPGYFMLEKIKPNKSNIQRLTTDEAGTLAPLQKPQIEPKLIPGKPKSKTDLWKRDIILDELEPVTITRTKTLKIPRPDSLLKVPAGLGVLQGTRTTPMIAATPLLPHFSPPTLPTLPAFDTKPAPPKPISIVDPLPDTLTGLDSDTIPRTDTQTDSILDIPVDIVTPVKWDNPLPSDPLPPDPLPPDPFPSLLPPPLPPGGGLHLPGFGFYPSTRRRRTKNKRLKNDYGDPFKIKIKGLTK